MSLILNFTKWCKSTFGELVYHLIHRSVLRSPPALPETSSTAMVDRATFWRTEVIRILRRMLELASYSPEAVDQHISTYSTNITQHLGPIPAEFATSTTLKPCSLMLDDHGPSELGWAIDSAGRGMIVRFYAEPLSSSDGTPAPRSRWMDILNDFVRHGGQSNVDLAWVRACADALTCEPPASDGGVGSGTSQFVLGADLEKSGLVGKAYFWPTLRARTTGIPNAQLVDTLTAQLGLTDQWGIVRSYLATLPASHGATPEVVAVSTVAPSRNGMKIYIRTYASTLSELLPYMTLGEHPSLVQHAGVQSAVDSLRRFWRLLFGVDENTPVRSHNPEFWASGILVYYDLALGRAYPLPKLFIDVRHRCTDDAQIARAIVGYCMETGAETMAGWYEKEIRTMFRHRPLEERAGIHTSVGVGVKKTGPRITLYYSPEVFSPRPCSALALEAK